MTVLDIGSGWGGGLALYLGEAADARVTGVTLSAEQLKVVLAPKSSGHAQRSFLRVPL